MKIKLSKSQWNMIGEKTGWMKKASNNYAYYFIAPSLQKSKEQRDVINRNILPFLENHEKHLNFVYKLDKNELDFKEVEDGWKVKTLDNNGRFVQDVLIHFGKFVYVEEISSQGYENEDFARQEPWNEEFPMEDNDVEIEDDNLK